MIDDGVRRPTSRRRVGRGAVVLMIVVALTGCTGGPASAPPAAHPTSPATVVPANYHPRAVPAVDRLTASELACGRRLPRLTFPTSENVVELRDTEASVADDMSNVAPAGDGRATVVSARISASTGVQKDEATTAELSGETTAALVAAGRVVATATGRVVPAHTTPRFTSLVSVTLPAASCSRGAPLRDGSYSLVVVGPTVRYLGETVPVAAAVRTVTLRHGILIGDITSAPTGPWHGSGVPTCGSTVSTAALTAFARSNATARTRIGLDARITGFEPHANGQGWSFTVRVRNVSRSAVTLTQGDPASVPGGASTAIVANGHIVSAPDAFQFSAAGPRAVTLAPEKAITVDADAPAAGCGLSADSTTWSPRLPDTAHLAYIDLGLNTRDGTGVVLTQRYDFHGKNDRPELLH